MYNYPSEQRVELPGWGDEPFCATLRRPSLLSLAAQGIIPNELLACARQLFAQGDGSALRLDELGRLLTIIAENALCSPTLSELRAKGLELTDEQLSAIYSFTQAGVRALRSFRAQREDADHSGDEQGVQTRSE